MTVPIISMSPSSRVRIDSFMAKRMFAQCTGYATEVDGVWGNTGRNVNMLVSIRTCGCVQ